jgi:hypothetical protein
MASRISFIYYLALKDLVFMSFLYRIRWRRGRDFLGSKIWYLGERLKDLLHDFGLEVHFYEKAGWCWD